MARFTYRPAPLAKEIEITVEGGILARDGHWRVDLADVVRIRRSVINVQLQRFDEVQLHLRDGTTRRLGISIPRGGSDAALIYTAMVNTVLATVDPDTPVQFGHQTWVRWVMSGLALACFALGGTIFALEGFDPDVIAPGLTILIVGAGLLWVYRPFGGLPTQTAARAVGRFRDHPRGLPKNQADDTGNTRD